MKTLFLVMLLGVSLRSFAQTTPTPVIPPQKTALIKQLIVLTGAVESAQSVMKASAAQQKQIPNPNVPAGFWDEFMRRVTDEVLIGLYLPIYDRHYSEQDLRQLIAFYESPVGRKVTAETPLVLQESMEAGRAWGAQLAKEVLEQLKKE